jgi:hypothetical protein
VANLAQPHGTFTAVRQHLPPISNQKWKEFIPLSTRLNALIVAAVFFCAGSGLFAQAPNPAPLPNARAVLGYLNQTIDWHRHFTAEQHVATDPSDLLSMSNDQRMDTEILRLAFEFAQADAQLLTQENADNTQPSTQPNYQSLSHTAAAADVEVKQLQQELDSARQKLQTAKPRERKQI